MYGGCYHDQYARRRSVCYFCSVGPPPRAHRRLIGAYGEAEFAFACVNTILNQFRQLTNPRCIVSSIKVLTIVGLIILGIILDLGGGPDHDM